MKALQFLVLLFFAVNTFAQDDTFNPYFQFEAGKTCYLAASDVNLRAKPDTKSESLAKMPIGTELKIENIEETTMVLNGFNAPWFKVNYNGKVGYIWSGFVSLRDLNSAENPKLRFVFGISKIERKKEKDYEFDAVTMHLRVCENGKELQKIEFDGRGSSQTSRSADILSKKGVTGVSSIIDIEYSDNYCGGSFGNHVFFWDGKKLYLAKHLQGGADAPCFALQELIYPNDEGGKAGFILMKSESGCANEEDAEKIDYSERTMEEFVWKNNKLSSVKKYDIK